MMNVGNKRMGLYVHVHGPVKVKGRENGKQERGREREGDGCAPEKERQK